MKNWIRWCIVSGLAFCIAAGSLLLAQRENRRRANSTSTLCDGARPCRGKNPLAKDIRVLQENGARPHWSPDGRTIAYDRRDSDGWADVYVTDLNGNARSLTAGKKGLPQKNNGNPIYHPSGDYIVFISEEEDHFADRSKLMGDPGIGLFSNLWATDPNGSRFWKLTNIPIKKRLFDRTPSIATVNPRFSLDGKTLIWTERYANGGEWGKWRLKAADFRVDGGTPKIGNERVLMDAKKGRYVTAMGFIDPRRLLVSGTLDGQHEYAMDLYVHDINTNRDTRLLNTPKFWEEGACVSPNQNKIAFMTNADSRYPLDFKNSDWGKQIVERDYYIMDADGSNQQRLTYFNDPSAPEYLGGRNIVAVCEFSPDGRYLAGTLGIDKSTGEKADIQLQVVLIELENRL